MKRLKYKITKLFENTLYRIKERYYRKQDDKYYNLMYNMPETYSEVKESWWYCFDYTLRRWGFNKKARIQLFENFEMDNWEALHQDQTEYKDCTWKELLGHFQGECGYVCDRMSFDRLFRTHWLYLRTFQQERFEEWKSRL